MKIGLIGQGAIGRYVMAELSQRNLTPAVILVRPERADESLEDGIARVGHVNDLPEDLDLMIDCAGHAALSTHGPAILARGVDVVTVSLEALAEQGVQIALEAAARKGDSRLHLASGAIGALDCLQAARVGGLSEVIYVGRKPPLGWKGSPAEQVMNLNEIVYETVHFQGTAREAATRYPKNANVAAAVALAGVGFDDTHVQLIADPGIFANVHEIRAKGAFGSFHFRVDGQALPDNPRSSALAAMSTVFAIERQRSLIVI